MLYWTVGVLVGVPDKDPARTNRWGPVEQENMAVDSESWQNLLRINPPPSSEPLPLGVGESWNLQSPDEVPSFDGSSIPISSLPKIPCEVSGRSSYYIPTVPIEI